MKITLYRSFEILHFKMPETKRYFKIYQDGEFKQTCKTLKQAKHLIDWCLQHGIWHE